MRHSALLLLICALPLLAAAQEQPSAELTVTKFECPKYPPKAESMRLQGMVRMQVTTDGHQVASVKLTSGHPVLAQAADQNVRTWEFADHSPTTFAVTYFYVNDGHYKSDPVAKCSARMELPTKVTVSTKFSFP